MPRPINLGVNMVHGQRRNSRLQLKNPAEYPPTATQIGPPQKATILDRNRHYRGRFLAIQRWRLRLKQKSRSASLPAIAKKNRCGIEVIDEKSGNLRPRVRGQNQDTFRFLEEYCHTPKLQAVRNSRAIRPKPASRRNQLKAIGDPTAPHKTRKWKPDEQAQVNIARQNR